MKKNKSPISWVIALDSKISHFADYRVATTLSGKFGFVIVFFRTTVVFLAIFHWLLSVLGVVPVHPWFTKYTWVPVSLIPIITMIFWYYLHEVRCVTSRLVNR